MGNTHNHNVWFSKSKRKLILLGFEGSGKSTFLEFIKSGKFFDSYTPTSDAEIYEKKAFDQQWLIFDLAGGVRQRVFWRHHYSGTQGVVFFIDASETDEKIMESVKELKKVFAEPELSHASFLVYLNKVDKLGQTFSRDAMLEKYDLKDMLRDPRIAVEVCSVKNDIKIKEGLEWLSKSMVAL